MKNTQVNPSFDPDEFIDQLPTQLAAEMKDVISEMKDVIVTLLAPVIFKEAFHDKFEGDADKENERIRAWLEGPASANKIPAEKLVAAWLEARDTFVIPG